MSACAWSMPRIVSLTRKRESSPAAASVAGRVTARSVVRRCPGAGEPTRLSARSSRAMPSPTTSHQPHSFFLAYAGVTARPPPGPPPPAAACSVTCRSTSRAAPAGLSAAATDRRGKARKWRRICAAASADALPRSAARRRRSPPQSQRPCPACTPQSLGARCRAAARSTPPRSRGRRNSCPAAWPARRRSGRPPRRS